MSNLDFENNLSEALCCLEKIETLTKLLQQTIVEQTDFNQKDSLNICSILKFYTNETKSKLNSVENSVSEKIL